MFDYLAGNIGGLLKKFLPWLTLALLLTSAQSPVLAAWQQQQRDIMGTRVSVELWSARVFSEMDRIDALMSTYRDSSEVSYINRNASIEAVSVSEELLYLLQRSIHFSEISAGAFDITYASIGYAYDYDYRKQQKPSDQVVTQKLPAIDYRHLELSDRKIRFNNSAVRIDLGGIAKGYAVDRAIDILQRCGISRAMVSAGGFGTHAIRRELRCACRSATAPFQPPVTTSGFISKTVNACTTSSTRVPVAPRAAAGALPSLVPTP